MQPSAPSIDGAYGAAPPHPATSRRRRVSGYSLLEVMIAATIVAFMLGIALSQIKETSDAATYSTANADLRRMGQDILGRITQDLRSTQSQYCCIYSQASNGSAVSTGDTIEFARIVGVDTTTGLVTPERDSGGNVVFNRYSSAPTDVSNKHGVLKFRRGTSTASFIDNQSGELAVDSSGSSSGFFVTAASTVPLTTQTGLLSASFNNAFANAPVVITIKLVLTREIGTVKSQLAKATLETQVALRPDQKY